MDLKVSVNPAENQETCTFPGIFKERETGELAFFTALNSGIYITSVYRPFGNNGLDDCLSFSNLQKFMERFTPWRGTLVWVTF